MDAFAYNVPFIIHNNRLKPEEKQNEKKIKGEVEMEAQNFFFPFF